MLPPITLQITPWPWTVRRATRRSQYEVIGARNIIGGHDLVCVVDDIRPAVNAKFIAGTPIMHILAVEAIDRWDELLTAIGTPLPIREHIAAMTARDALLAHLRAVA